MPISASVAEKTDSSSAASTLEVVVPAPRAAFSSTFLVLATGGLTPYSFRVADCDSKINTVTGEFVAAQDPSSCVVIVTDSSGAIAYGVIGVGAI